MKIAGIIAEYDPFHNGHAYQIKQTKAAGAEAVVAVLGGDFWLGETATQARALLRRWTNL